MLLSKNAQLLRLTARLLSLPFYPFMTHLLSVKRCLNEQLYQSFWQSVKQQKFKAKKIRGVKLTLPYSLTLRFKINGGDVYFS